MPSTHTSLHFHLIWATHQRQPLLGTEWRASLHEYLGGCARGLEAHPQGVGGVEDHVHMLVSLKPTHRLSDFMREVKKASSSWIREQHGLRDFHWQEGYAAFSVSASAREAVRTYIARQEEHHRKTSFRDELVAFLAKYEIEYDPRFLD